jgi:CheY-like chemotaxis protein
MASGSTSALRAWRILVVDDEALVALTLQDGLSKLLGGEVTAATSGEQALQLIRQQPFDLLITDYRMPNMNGITLVERAHEMYPGLLSVMITADPSDELRDQATHGSIQCILHKPITLTELRSVIEALVRSGTGTTGE